MIGRASRWSVRAHSLLFMLMLVSTAAAQTGAAPTSHAPEKVPLYGTYEISLPIRAVSGNEFTKYPKAEFWNDRQKFYVEGFFDGNDRWKVRFMPNAEGAWTYRWSFEGSTGKGRFHVGPNRNPMVHGHVGIDTDHPRYLKYDDGALHYWYGGMWFRAAALGPQSKRGIVNPDHLSDDTIIDYLDTLVRYRHNGVLLQVSFIPLEADALSWDLDWMRRIEWFLHAAGARGIYVQVNLFNTWAGARAEGLDAVLRRRQWFKREMRGGRQVMNVWSERDQHLKRNYIRYIVARLAGYYNVYWELGNEMAHRPNDGRAFVRLANQYYLPWLRHYDPYSLPIGLSEVDTAASADVDIVFAHQTYQTPPPDAQRPWIMNEPVSGWGGRAGEFAAYEASRFLWSGDAIRDPANRLGYRRTFWRMLTTGGSGSSEATHPDLTRRINQAMLEVMADHMRLRDFIESLPVPLTEMQPVDGFLQTDEPSVRSTLAAPGKVYVTYLLSDEAPPREVRLRLPPGTYRYTWIDPADGLQRHSSTIVTRDSSAMTRDSSAIVKRPFVDDDLVLLVVAE